MWGIGMHYGGGGTVLKISEIILMFGKLYDKINNIKIKYIIKCKINYKI